MGSQLPAKKPLALLVCYPKIWVQHVCYLYKWFLLTFPAIVWILVARRNDLDCKVHKWQMKIDRYLNLAVLLSFSFRCSIWKFECNMYTTPISDEYLILVCYLKIWVLLYTTLITTICLILVCYLKIWV